MRNILELAAACIAAVCVLATVLSLLYPQAVDWRPAQTGLGLALVACASGLWFEKLRRGGRWKFALAVVLGVGVNCLAIVSLWAIDHAADSGLYGVLSTYGCLMIVIGFIGAYCEPYADDARPHPSSSRR